MQIFLKWAARVRILCALCLVPLLTLFNSGSAVAQTTSLVVSGTLEAQEWNAAPMATLTGPRGFSLTYPMTIRDNFFLSDCRSYPTCKPGTSVSLSAVTGDSNYQVTFDGRTYRGGGLSSTAGMTFQISGSVTLPPMAATATASAPFSYSATVFLDGNGSIDLTGQGTATLALRQQGTQAPFNENWVVDDVKLVFDGPLPSPWVNVDVGAVGMAGSTSINGATPASATMAGAGADVWGTADAFQFAASTSSVHEVIARIDALDNTDPWAKAGVMMRASLDAASPHVFLAVKPDGDVELLRRSSAGAATEFLAGAAGDFPMWVKLTRGEQIAASISHDGQQWQLLRTMPLLPAGYYSEPFAGLAVTSRNPSATATAQISQLLLDGTSAAPQLSTAHADIGAVQIAGNAVSNGTQIAVTASGEDIWGTADAFHFVYDSVPADGEVRARIVSMQNTSAWAKAGVMLRDALTPDAGHVFLAAKPGGGIELLSRQSSGEPTQLMATDAQAFPMWLRLQRTGTTYTASVSADGNSWRTVGVVMRPVPSGFVQPAGYGGVAVTSQNPSQTNTAIFDPFMLTAEPPPQTSWVSQDIGAVGQNGKATLAGGSGSIAGAGADIWGNVDAFHFLFQQRDTYQQTFSVRIASEMPTNEYAKVGLMVRGGTTADAPFVMLAMKPDGSLEVLQRQTAGAAAKFLGGAYAGIGSYLRMIPNGTSVALSYSADGTTWTPLMTVAYGESSLGSFADIGIAVTSLDVNRLNTATFDHVEFP